MDENYPMEEEVKNGVNLKKSKYIIIERAYKKLRRFYKLALYFLNQLANL
tara:strand:+ start:1529 stop:1678 length:150 start_codon:yes stop_codon:yes gene_type:complete